MKTDRVQRAPTKIEKFAQEVVEKTEELQERRGTIAKLIEEEQQEIAFAQIREKVADEQAHALEGDL